MHAVKCPDCSSEMVEIRRPTVEVDACTNCHGAWFDSGELDLHLEQVLKLEVPSLEFTPKRPLDCPHCAERLEPHVIPRVKGAAVDVCGRHGLFARGGVLLQLNSWAQSTPLTIGSPPQMNTTTSNVTESRSSAVSLDSATGDLALEGVGVVAEILFAVLAALVD